MHSIAVERTMLKDVVKIRQSTNDSNENNNNNLDEGYYDKIDSNFFDVDNFTISDPDQLKSVRLSLVKLISKIISYNNWNQKYAANLLKIDQPKISQIKNFKTEGFSLERLIRFFILLGWKIDIKLTK
jgi:predicted XRE-type DNA-binding protein